MLGQIVRHLLERKSLGLRHTEGDPNQLKHHHQAKEDKDGSGSDELKEERDEGGNYCSQYPMHRGAKRLPGGTQLVRENLGDKNPDDGSLPDGVRGDKNTEENRHRGGFPSEKEGHGDQPERDDVPKRAYQHQGAPAILIYE